MTIFKIGDKVQVKKGSYVIDHITFQQKPHGKTFIVNDVFLLDRLCHAQAGKYGIRIDGLDDFYFFAEHFEKAQTTGFVIE
jgi:hypothetical protein